MPSFPKFKLVRIDDTNTNIKINQNLDSIKQVMDTLTSQPNKIVLSQITLTTGLNTVPHTLNKPLTNWSLLDINANASVWSSQFNTTIATLPNIFLYLNASAPCIVNLEVW